MEMISSVRLTSSFDIPPHPLVLFLADLATGVAFVEYLARGRASEVAAISLRRVADAAADRQLYYVVQHDKRHDGHEEYEQHPKQPGQRLHRSHRDPPSSASRREMTAFYRLRSQDAQCPRQ